jgi:hypothetical protein
MRSAARSDEVVGGHGGDEAGTPSFEVAIEDLRHATDDLGPVECLFDPLAMRDRQGIAGEVANLLEKGSGVPLA